MSLSKLNQLKTALAAITPEAWRFDAEYSVDNDGNALIVDVQDVAIARCYQQPHDTWLASDNANFIILAHEMMPDLLEAVKVLERVLNEAESITNGSTTWPFAHRLIEKLNSVESNLNEATIDAQSKLRYTVNQYLFATMNIIANDAEDAGRIAINSTFEWDIKSSKYDASWSVNDCMMVDVTNVETDEDSEFEYSSLAGKYELPAFIDGNQFKVRFYINAHLIIDDAEDEDDALLKAKSVDIMGDVTANGIIIDDCAISGSVEADVTVEPLF